MSSQHDVGNASLNELSTVHRGKCFKLMTIVRFMRFTAKASM